MTGTALERNCGSTPGGTRDCCCAGSMEVATRHGTFGQLTRTRQTGNAGVRMTVRVSAIPSTMADFFVRPFSEMPHNPAQEVRSGNWFTCGACCRRRRSVSASGAGFLFARFTCRRASGNALRGGTVWSNPAGSDLSETCVWFG